MYEITAFISPSKDETKKVPVKLLYTDKATGKGWIETDAMVLAKDWDAKREIVKKTDAFYKEKNEIIAADRNKLEKWILDYRNANGVLPDGRRLKELYNPITPVKTEKTEVLIRKYKDYRYSIGIKDQTWGFYETALSRLKEFEPNLNPEKCGIVWAKQFETWLYSTERKEKRVTSVNTIANYFTAVRGLLTFLSKSGLTKLSELDIEAIKAKARKRHIVTHTTEELQKMFEADFFDKDKFPGLQITTRRNLSLTRDTYLIMFYTFLRCIDLKPDKWKWENKAIGNEVKRFLTVKLQKTADSTGAIVSFPVHPTAIEIMERYPETKGVPPVKHNVTKYYVHEMARLSGITELVKLVNPRRKFEENSEVPKCDLMVMHSACGAGMTYARSVAKMRVEDIAKQAGRKIATLENGYFGHDDEHTAEVSEAGHALMPKLTFSVQEVKAVGA